MRRAITLSAIGGGLKMRSDAASAFRAMQSAAAADGVQLVPSGPRAAWRSPAMQASLVAERPDYAAPVGRSEHQLGIAIDLVTDGGRNAAYAWLVKHAARYGFFATAMKRKNREPWHWVFLGVKNG